MADPQVPDFTQSDPGSDLGSDLGFNLPSFMKKKPKKQKTLSDKARLAKAIGLQNKLNDVVVGSQPLEGSNIAPEGMK